MNQCVWFFALPKVYEEYKFPIKDEVKYPSGKYLRHVEITSPMIVRAWGDDRVMIMDDETKAIYNEWVECPTEGETV